MKKKRNKENFVKGCIVSLCIFLTGCGSIGLAREASFESAYENEPEKEEIDIYLSEGCGVLKQVNAQENTLTIYQLSRSEELTLFYDGATSVQDKYGAPLSMEQLIAGEVVTVRYNSELEKAGGVMYTPEIWNYDGVAKYSIDENQGILQVGEDAYRISRETKVFSEGEEITFNQILNQDVISLRGTDREIVSIMIEKGHGYLDLENEKDLVGAWIEVGQTAIQQVTEDMLITVPEGDYTVRLTMDSIEEARDVTIERNKETVLDLGDIDVPKSASGRVTFSIYPADASVSVDGVSINTAYTVLLPFGLHQVTASASGYDTVSEYFNVEGENTAVRLALSESLDMGTVSDNSITESDYHTITIKTPEGAEVYQDNLYMGIVPVVYQKTAGTHTITLRKTGYITKSYQIVVENDNRDLVYSFDALEVDTSATVSGNNLTDGTSADGKNNGTVSGNNATVSGNNTTVSGNEAAGDGNKTN